MKKGKVTIFQDMGDNTPFKILSELGEMTLTEFEELCMHREASYENEDNYAVYYRNGNIVLALAYSEE